MLMTAAAVPQTRKYTLEDFNALPVGPPNYEFDEGEIIPLGSPTITHQDIIDEFIIQLKPFIRKSDLGRLFREVDVYLPDGRVYVPDFGFLAMNHMEALSPIDGKIHGTPTMVAEVTSTDGARDRTRKFHVYLANGVEWYWLITQSLIIEEYRATEGGYVRVSSIAPGEVFRPQLFPGLEINLAELLGALQAGEAKEDSSEQTG
jgi:Uma2 family endonuclease